MQQNHKEVRGIHGAPILREIRLMDGPLEKRLFGPLGIPQDNSIPTLQATSTGRTGATGGTNQDPFAGFNPYVNPFSSSYTSRAGNDPFSSLFNMFFPQEKTLEDLLKEAKKDLGLDVKLIAVKLILLALAFALSVPATGLFLYTIISIGQGVWKRLRYLSLIFLVPFAMLALIFAPAGTAHIGLIPFILFGCAVIFDIQNVYRHAKRIRDIKRRMNA